LVDIETSSAAIKTRGGVTYPVYVQMIYTPMAEVSYASINDLYLSLVRYSPAIVSGLGYLTGREGAG